MFEENNSKPIESILESFVKGPESQVVSGTISNLKENSSQETEIRDMENGNMTHRPDKLLVES